MSDLKSTDPFVCTDPSEFEEDELTLAAIDAGIRDAEAGRVVPIEEVRKLIVQWSAKYSSQEQR